MNARVPLITISTLILAGGGLAADLWRAAPAPGGGERVVLAGEALDRLVEGQDAAATVQIGGETLPLTVTRLADGVHGIRIVRGVLDGREDAYVLLCRARDGATSALLQRPEGGRYQLDWSVADDSYRIDPLEDEDPGSCAGAIEAPAWLVPDRPSRRWPDGGQPSSPRDLGDAADDGSRHDVLVVYSPKARDEAGGDSQIEVEIQLAVEAANLVYDNSLVTSSLRLVATSYADYDEDQAWEYLDHLYALADPDDGWMDDIPLLRDRVGADFTTLIVESTDALGNPIGDCGIAFLMQSDTWNHDFEYLAFSVVSRRCASSVYTLAHEIGHNRGCAHNREDASYDGVFSYSYGHRFTGNDDLGYRTVMSYDTDPESMERIPFFSNPELVYAGVPIGVPIGQPGESHCTQTQNLTSPVCAGFRGERTFVEFGWDGESDGLVHTPFATIADAITGSRAGGIIVLRGSDTAQGYTLAVTPRVYVHEGNGTTVLGQP